MSKEKEVNKDEDYQDHIREEWHDTCGGQIWVGDDYVQELAKQEEKRERDKRLYGPWDF